jgi:hypothetical protein
MVRDSATGLMGHKEGPTEVRGLEGRLGRFRAAYSASRGKVVINLILGLIWCFLGFALFSTLWDYGSRPVAVVIGLVFLASGAAYVIVPYRRRVGRKARLYEEGIWVSVRGKAASWRFDEVDGVRVVFGGSMTAVDGLSRGVGWAIGGIVGGLAAGLVKGVLKAAVPSDGPLGAEAKRYQFYVGGVRAFDIGPEYSRWKELGKRVYRAVMSRLVPRLVDCLVRGEQVVFDGLTDGGFAKTYLTFTRESIQEREREPVPWTDVKGISRNGESVWATVKTSDRKTDVTFGVCSALNALVALEVAKAMTRNIRIG